MFHAKSSSKQKGFTLVELVVVAPIALLIISGFVALMVTMVGDVIASRTYNTITYDIQDALDTIERDVKLSTQFLTTSGTMLSPQGKNGGTSAFTSTSGDLILGGIATDKNPIDPTRRFVHYDAPFSCSDPGQVYKNRVFYITVAYFVRDNSLWRRTYVPPESGTLCTNPWQVNTCAPGYPSTATRCKANDSEILKNISSSNGFNVSYYLNPEDTTALAASSATSASTIRVTIGGQRSAAGREVTASSAARTTKLSAKDITLSPPDSPNVTASVSTPDTATFSWPTVANATSYIVQYNINGGNWITASENTTETSFSVPAYRQATVSVKVFARNATGTSADTSSNNASTTIPSWYGCGFQNGWANYGGGHATCGYTKTKDGIVMLKGLITVPGSSDPSPNSEVLFTLPPGYRPKGGSLIFSSSTWNSTRTSGTTARVDVRANGDVIVISGNDRWLSLSDIRFVPEGSLYNWTTPTLLNGWVDYGNPYAPFQMTKDASDRVHAQGLVKPGPSTTLRDIANLPAGFQPSEHTNLPDYWPNIKRFYTTRIEAGRVPTPNTGYYSMQAMYYPSAFSGWTSLALANGWSDYLGGHTTAQFTRSSDCIVTVKGLIKGTSAPNGVVVGVLPVGYRPAETLILAGVNNGAGTATYHRITIEPSGNIRVEYADTVWTSLNGIHFVAGGSTQCPS